MKNILLSLTLLVSFLSSADQLSYVTKAEAEQAASYINKRKNIILFCGCCALIKPVKVKVIRAEAIHTGYEDYYEVTIHYLDENGQEVNKNIDLAYVWIKKFFGPKTLGKIMNLEHDYCVKPKDYNNPKYIEKDI